MAFVALDMFSLGSTLGSFLPDNEAGNIVGNVLNPIGAISNFVSGNKRQEAPDYGMIMEKSLNIVGLLVGGLFGITVISKIVKGK